MFASSVTKKVAIKDDGGGNDVVVTVRKLSWGQLNKAREANSDAALATASKAGPEMLRVFREGLPGDKDREKKEPTVKELRESVYRMYDIKTVLELGVESWTIERNVKQALGDLDEETATLLHREIIDLSVPQADPVEARGEGYATSTLS